MIMTLQKGGFMTTRKHIAFFVHMDDIPRTTAQQKDITTRGGFPRLVDSKNLKTAKTIWHYALANHVPKEMLKKPLRVKILYCFKASKTNKADTFKTTSPDTDNLQKLPKDIMQALEYYKNDGEVAFDEAVKVFSDVPGVLVKVSELPKKVNVKQYIADVLKEPDKEITIIDYIYD